MTVRALDPQTYPHNGTDIHGPRLWVVYQWGEGVLSEAQELRRLAEQCLQATRATSNLVIPGDACFAYFNKIRGIPL